MAQLYVQKYPLSSFLFCIWDASRPERRILISSALSAGIGSPDNLKKYDLSKKLTLTK